MLKIGSGTKAREPQQPGEASQPLLEEFVERSENSESEFV
jgi:hypothetical protein